MMFPKRAIVPIAALVAVFALFTACSNPVGGSSGGENRVAEADAEETDAADETEEKVSPAGPAISAGGFHTLILRSDDTLWGTGWNQFGQLGDGTTNDRSTPQEIMTDVAAVSAGYGHTMILKTDASLWATGGNSSGHLGDVTTDDRSTPVQVMLNNAPMTDVAAVSAGESHTMILKTDGTLWGVGFNNFGQLGDGTTGSNRLEPVQVRIDGEPVRDVTAVSTGYWHTMFVRSDGSVWGMGRNLEGQLGDGSTESPRPEPVQVMLDGDPMTDVAAVSAGEDYTMIIKTDGTLWATGDNSFGQFGDGTKTDRLSPVEVMTDVAAVSAGEAHTMILKNDGSLWGMGRNLEGQLGNGTTENRSTPVEVMLDDAPKTDVAAVSAGAEHTIILKTDGTVWATGFNQDGQLGDGTTTTRFSPVQVPLP